MFYGLSRIGDEFCSKMIAILIHALIHWIHSKFLEVQIFCCPLPTPLRNPSQASIFEGMVGKRSGRNAGFWKTKKLALGHTKFSDFCCPSTPRKVSVNSSQNTLCLVVFQHIVPKPMILIGADLGQFLIITEG